MCVCVCGGGGLLWSIASPTPSSPFLGPCDLFSDSTLYKSLNIVLLIIGPMMIERGLLDSAGEKKKKKKKGKMKKVKQLGICQFCITTSTLSDSLSKITQHICMHTHTHTHRQTNIHTHTHTLVIPPNRGRYDTQCIQSVYYMQSGTEHYDVQHAIGDALCMSMTVH